MEKEELAKKVSKIEERVSRLEKKLSGANMKGAKKRMLTTEEAATFLGITVDGLRGLTYKKIIPYYKPNGKNIYIEVKSIDYVGQKFRMTNNEFAAAQYKPSNYYLALVYQNKDSFEISLIKDPVNRLNLTRQVVQWVWECTDYEYRPMKFSL